MRGGRARIWVLLVVGVLATAIAVVAIEPTPANAATCSEHANQAEAQRAADTRDADGDGAYCETLPCPCAGPGSGSGSPDDGAPRGEASCVRPRRRITISFSATRYPNVRRHFRAAVADGWPRTMVVNRRGADARRDRLLEGYEAREGFDRDEYPAAVGRGRGRGLEHGRNPRGWRASVAYVPSSENRSHGAVLGIKLRRFCDGTRFRYVFY
jgi:hypothetical protein